MITEETLTFDGWCDNPEPRTARKVNCVLVEIPTRFYDDHCWRDLASGSVVSAGKRLTVVWLDEEAFTDIYGDAALYAGFEGWDYRENRSICDSARRTLDRLRAQVPTWSRRLGEKEM